jgi:hypothetical protein
MSDRPPCPNCGGTGLTFGVISNETIALSDHLISEFILGNQERDWHQRWKLIEEGIQRISMPLTETRSRNSIHDALEQLFSFLIQTYHLKDALKAAALGLGLKEAEIEDAITNDLRLAVLADLANLDKHGKLTKPPCSGHIPIIEQTSGIDDTTGKGWKLVVRIKHGTSMLDGLTVARDAVFAWREKLTVWGLI